MPVDRNFRTLIIDDETKARENMQYMISTYCPRLNVVGEAWDRGSIERELKNRKTEVIFMDVQIQDTTIFEIVDYQWIRNSMVVFTTAHSDFALDGYSFKAIDYLLKPIHSKKFIEVYHNIIELSEIQSQEIDIDKKNIKSEVPRIRITDSGGMYFVEIKNILYLIGEGNYTTFHLLNGDKKTISKNLKHFENSLANHNFFRLSKSSLINLTHIISYQKEDGGSVTMRDTQTHSISRAYKSDFLDLLEDVTIG